MFDLTVIGQIRLFLLGRTLLNFFGACLARVLLGLFDDQENVVNAAFRDV